MKCKACGKDYYNACDCLSSAGVRTIGKQKPKLVVIESPFKGDIDTNLRYARAAARDCFKRGEAPYASHLLYTQEGILDDSIPEERAQGIEAGLLWGSAAELVAVYTDLGVTDGMKLGIVRHLKEGRFVEERSLGLWRVKTCECRAYGRDDCCGNPIPMNMRGLSTTCAYCAGGHKEPVR